MQQHTQTATAKDQRAKTPCTPVVPSAPTPVDTRLLQHVSGGSARLPNGLW